MATVADPECVRGGGVSPMLYPPLSERYKRLANALQTLQMLPNGLSTLPMACKCLRKLTSNDSIRNIR